MTSSNEQTPLMNGMYALAELDAEEMSQELAANWKILLALGGVNLLCGILALVSPVPATEVAFMLIVLSLFAAGGFNTLGMFYVEKCYRKASGIVGMCQTLLGVLMVTIGEEGSLLILTILIAALFVVDGTYRSVLAYKNRDMPGFGTMMGSGICQILFGLLVILAFPRSSLFTIGILLGVNLFFFGTSRIALGLLGRKIANNQIEAAGGDYVSAA